MSQRPGPVHRGLHRWGKPYGLKTTPHPTAAAADTEASLSIWLACDPGLATEIERQREKLRVGPGAMCSSRFSGCLVLA